MAAIFRVVLFIGAESIVDESFTAESVEQIIACIPEGVSHVNSEKVRDLGPEPVTDESVWMELISMRENLAEAQATDRLDNCAV